MGVPSDDVVVIQAPEMAGKPSVITISCPDKTGLGCDRCRVILFFGLSILRGGEVPHRWKFPILLLKVGALGDPSRGFADLVIVWLCSVVDVSTNGKWCYIVNLTTEFTVAQ
ncbi:hypothetical protein B296_00014673 [Ensete ventricosum]|uniref:ACT domain-containing protein n=1 Tax=Ensete ventricosum TaxID=4639 RepID=A0A426ZNH8_ENSVE|nr:hypothetical protein B296_00014673 [Ensete ventricosum]